MLCPTFVWWHAGYPVYKYASIICLIVNIWRKKKKYHGFKLESNRSACEQCQRVSQRARDAPPRARRPSEEEAEKLQERLTVTKRQGWLPQEGRVLQLLYTNLYYHISDDTALDIEQLVTGKNTLITPISAGTSPHSSCLEILSISGVSKQSLRLRSKNSREFLLASVTSTLLKLADQKSLTQMAGPSTGVVSIQDHWDEHLQLGKGFQLPDVPRDPGTTTSSRLEESGVPVNQQQMMYSSQRFFHGNQGQQPLRSHVSLLFLTTDLTNLTHGIAMHMVTISLVHLPLLSPELLRLLEVHVKKWMHFQRRGLLGHVEESLRQLMPHIPVTFTKCDNLNACVETTGTISHKTWGSCMLSQPTQAFWLFKWSIRDEEQSCHCQKTPNPLALALPSAALKVLIGLYPQPERQAEDSGDRLKQKHSQLFCAFSSLTSEALLVTYIEYPGTSANRYIPQFPKNVPFFFNECSVLLLFPNNPTQSTSPSSTSTPNSVSPTDHQRNHINIPFLALAKFKALEWNLLQRHLLVRWELPTAFNKSQCAQSLMQYKPCDTAQSPETLGTSWSGKPVSLLMGELPFLPDHAQMLLEFHLQKQLMRHHWGLSQRIKESTALLLSPADQQPLPSSSKALDHLNVPWPAAPEVSGVGDLISLTLAPVSDSMPHLLTQTKAILQSHIDSKCWQTLQGTVIAHIFISQGCGMPGSTKGPQFPCKPENKLLELQAATDPDISQKVRSSQTLPGAVIESTKLSRSLPKGAMEKLGANLQDKHLAFLSGLPALYYLAPSKATGPPITSQSAIAEIMPEPVEITPDSLTEMISCEERCISPGPGHQDDETHADGAQEFLTKVQEERTKETVRPEIQRDAAILKALKTSILTKLNFHLRKKVLEMHLGIPIKARESRNRCVAVSVNLPTQEAPGSLNSQGKTWLQKLLIPPNSPYAPGPELIVLTQKLILELKAVLRRKKQASSRAGPQGSAHRVSKISQLSRDMTDAQELCAQVEARVNSPSLEEARCPESQGPGKSNDSAQVPTLAETDADVPQALKPSILTKLNFHLRKKVLEVQLGIPIKVRESWNQLVAFLEKLPTQEVLGNLNNRGKTSLQELPIQIHSAQAPEQQLICLRKQLIVELKAVQQRKNQASSTGGPHGSAHQVSKISQLSEDTADAQELCAQVEARVNSRSLEGAWCPESQGPGKTKDSGQVPTLAVKKEYPQKQKPQGDSKERNAGFGLPSTVENRHPAEDQKPAGLSVNRTPGGPWQRSQSFDIAASCQQSPKYCPQFKLPKVPPGAAGGKDSEKNDTEDSETNLSVITEAARNPGTAQPVVPQASQGQSLLGPLIQGNLLQKKLLQNDTPQEQVRVACTQKSPDLTEFGLKNKMKCIFHCINPKRVHEESMFSPEKKGAKTRKNNLKKSLAPAKGPVPHAQIRMQNELCETVQYPETVGTSWSRKTVSVLMAELPLFLDHAQRLLEFYLQKQLIQDRWGVSQKIKQSTVLLLYTADLQPLPLSSKALDHLNVPWCAAPEFSGVSDLISLTLAPVSDSMPHLLTQTKAILQSHMDSKCWPILQGTVIAHIFISRDWGIPGRTEVAQFPCNLENKLLELQAPTDPEMYQKVMSSQTVPGAVIEHTKLSRSLPKGAMEKLGANLQDKHLAFLSGLPALYYLAPSKATGPPITSQSAIAEIMPEPVEITPDSLTEMISCEERCISPGPGHQDDETHADGAQEFLTKVQEERTKETVRPETQRDAAILKALKTSILTKLNFHLRKKVLEMHLGIPIKARESRNRCVAVSVNLPTQEAPGSLNSQGKTWLQKLLIPPNSPYAPGPELIVLTQKLILELKAVLRRKKQASSRAGPQGSAHRVSKISQLSRDMTDAQELCAQVEARVNSPSLEEARCPESQGPGKTNDSGQVPTLAETGADVPKALRPSTLTKLNFHLRKKVLEVQLGIPIKVRKCQNQPVAFLEKLPTQEVLGSLNKQGKTSLQELSIPIYSAQAPEQQLICLRKQLIVELKAVQQRKKQGSSIAGPHGSAHQVSKISQLSEDTADAQELCAPVEATVNSRSLEEAWCPESRGPGKTKDSGQVPTLAVKKEYPWKPKPQSDSKEKNAGLRLPSPTENRHSTDDEKPAGLSVNRTPGGPWQRSQSFDIAASCQQSPKYCPQFKLPKVPPGAAGGKDSEKNEVEDSETNLNVITEAARNPGTAQPGVPQASQGRSSLGPRIPGKRLQDKTLWKETPEERVRLAHTQKSPGVPESGLRNKVKCSFRCINSKTLDEKSMFSPEEKVTKMRKNCLKRSLAPAKGPVGQAKTEKIIEDPKAQSVPTEKELSLAFSGGLEAPDKQL